VALRSVRFGVRSRKLSNVGQSLDVCPKIYYLELLRASEGTLSRWSRMYLQSLAPTNPHWARVVGYGTFSLCVIHKEGLCSGSGDINRLMMVILVAFNGIHKMDKSGASLLYTFIILRPFFHWGRQKSFHSIHSLHMPVASFSFIKFLICSPVQGTLDLVFV
jgi:hypothetical protein